MEPIRPYKIFYKTFQPVNRQIFDEITQRMLLVLKYYKRNRWDIRDIMLFMEKAAVQKIHIDNGSEGIVSHPQVIEFQTVYSNERRTIKCDLVTKNIPGVPDGRHEVFYIADTDEFVYGRDPKILEYMNIIFAPSVVDILYKDIGIIVATIRFHHDTYEHTKEVQERKMGHRETEDDKCDAAWQQELLHLSETLRQMNTEHTGIRYETILFHRGKHTPPVLFAYVVHLPNNVLHGVIAIIANLNDDTALELRYYENSSGGLLSHDDKNVVMSITHAGVACSGYDEAYQKLCANVGKDHGDKIVGMVQETTGDPIKQKEEVMADKNKWVSKLENIHNKIQQFKTERFSIESNFSQLNDEFAQITVYLRDKADDDGEPFGEIRYTTNEHHQFITTKGKYRAGLTIRYFSNRQDVHWCEPLSIVDENTGLYIFRDEPTVMLKDLGVRWTAKFIGLLRAEASDEPMIEEETDKKEECIVSERTHTIELRHVIIRKGVLPDGCDEHDHIALKIFSADDDDHKRIFKMYEDCPLKNATDVKERYAPSRDGDTTTVVIFVPNVDEIDMEKVYDYFSTITLTLNSLLIPGSCTLLNAVVKHIKVPSVGEWDGLPKKQHRDEPVKPTCEEDIEDVDADTTDGVETVVLHNVSYRVIKHVEPIFTIAHIIGLKDDEADRLMQLYEKCTSDLVEKFEHVKGFDPSAMEPKRLMRGIVQIPIVCYGSIAGIQLDTVGLGITRATKMKIRHDQGRYIPELDAIDISIADDSQVCCDKPKEGVEDMKAEQPKFGSSITQPREFTLRDVAIRVLPHAQDMNPIFVEFAPISELEKMAILNMYNSNPLDGDEAKRKRIDPQFWRIRGTNTFGVRLSVFITSSDMFQRLEAAVSYERFDVKLSMGRGQINITIESLTFKGIIHSSLELFESHTATELTKRAKRLAANSTCGMSTRSFDECVDEVARYVQAIERINPDVPVKTDRRNNTMIMNKTAIKDAFFNPKNGVFTVLWMDGTKTIARPMDGVEADPEIGLSICIAKKLFGNQNQMRKYLKGVVEKSTTITEKRDAKKVKKAAARKDEAATVEATAAPAPKKKPTTAKKPTTKKSTK